MTTSKRLFRTNSLNIYLINLVFFIALSDLTILLDIPYLRQFFGFVLLIVLPGLLIIQILKLNKLDITEQFVLMVAISNSFLIIFGLFVNNLFLEFGYNKPLSTIPLLISYNIILFVLILMFISIYIDKEYAIILPKIQFEKKAYLFISIAVILPALSIFGMHLMNKTNNNFFIMFLLILIIMYILYIFFFNNIFPEKLYPFVLYSISVSLLLMLPLRSNHIIGIDTHVEYQYFQSVIQNFHWGVYGERTIDSCLSTSLLPTIYTSVLNINAELMFKIIPSILFSISPLVVYIISKKYLNCTHSFFSTLFFMFQPLFLWTEANARTSIAILYFGLFFMVLFHEHITKVNKNILFILFSASCVVSHYSTTYIFFIILFIFQFTLQLLSVTLFKNSKVLSFFSGEASESEIHLLNDLKLNKETVSFTLVLLFFVMIFFWYSQITEVPFIRGVNFVYNTFSSLNSFLISESRGAEVSNAVNPSGALLLNQKIKFIVYWSTIFLTIVGVLVTALKSKEMISFSGSRLIKSSILESKIDIEYFLLGLICLFMLVISIALPFVLIQYNLSRLYFMLTMILSVFFTVGGISVSSFLKKGFCHNTIIVLSVLLLFFMCSSGLIDQILNTPGSVILNSDGKDYGTQYICDQDIGAAKWYSEYAELQDNLYLDVLASNIFNDYVSLSNSKTKKLLLPSKNSQDNYDQGYIFLRYYNSVYNTLIDDSYQPYSISECKGLFSNKNLIYTSGGSQLWK